VLVGAADDRNVGDRRMGEQDVLELGRGDLEARVLDDLLCGQLASNAGLDER
jgi:hypothetical protein